MGDGLRPHLSPSPAPGVGAKRLGALCSQGGLPAHSPHPGLSRGCPESPRGRHLGVLGARETQDHKG